MKKKILYFFLLLTTIMSSSCKEDVVSTAPRTTEDLLLQKLTRIANTKGGITIASRESYSQQSKKMVTNYQIDGSFDNNPFDYVQLGDIVLEPLQATRPDLISNQYVTMKTYSQDQISGVFGRKLSVKYHKPGTTVDLRDDFSIDTPNELGLGVPGISSGSSFRNIPMTWAAGNSSDNVYVLISFQPESVLNGSFRSYARIDRFVSVPDNGSYTIPNDQFAGIPQGGYVIIAVARGNTALAAGMATGTDRTSITAISSATLTGTIGGGGGNGGGTGGGGGGCGSDLCIEPYQ